MEIKGIKYIGPVLDGSGYAQACRGNILALHKLGIPLTVMPISFDKNRPDLGETGDILKKLSSNSIDYNIVIIHTTPEFWNKYREEGKVNVGYTIWETTLLHPDWPNYINDNVDKVLVGCEWNVDVFKNSGVNIPIGVVPHGINTKEFDNVTPYNISGVDEDTFMFYSIFQWCYDDKTRVLTRDGFKYFKHLSYEDEIATLNMKTEDLEYQKPEKIVSFRRKDKMMCLNGVFFDMCITPDHKMVVKDLKNPDLGWHLVSFNDLLSLGKSKQSIVSDRYRAKKNCKWLGEEKPIFEVPLLGGDEYPIHRDAPIEIDMDIFLEFMGWYLSEGSTYEAKRGYINTITQRKEKYRPEIISCIERMGYNVITTDKDIIFNSREMYYYLKQFGKCDNKFIPKWIKNLSSRQIKILLESLFKGDGSLYESGDWIKYTTTSKQLAEDVQECLLKIGMSGAISTEDPTLKTPGKIEGREIKGDLLQYIVSVNRERNEPSMYYADLEEIDYDGYVYCATVPNHAMLVERNGKIIFSGNTERKHPVALIKAYWCAFQNNENVSLVLKTYRNDYSEQEKDAIRTTIKRLKNSMVADNHAKICLIPNMLSNDEILGLHARGDCYVSLDRGEGFGLSPFTAGACSNPIIVTNFGGSTEYAKPDNSYLVDYCLTPVFGMPYSPWYRMDQMWAEPDVLDGAMKMRYVYDNQEEAKKKGLLLKNYISDNFSWECIGRKIVDEIKSI
jgi:glycosyltransferase involved in cell wall biosynthesis